jgi:hypothetical protein
VVSLRGRRPQREPSPVCGQAHGGQPPSGGLIRHGGSSAVVFEPSEGKAMDFESPGGLGTGGEARGAEPLEQQAQGPRLQGASMLGKGLGVKAPRGSLGLPEAWVIGFRTQQVQGPVEG